jgi:GH15 family glucan-1,4-alpha-glucosidase
MSKRIDDYALIGDCKTAALVSVEGSIDWLCVPRFDSASCFAALLGDESHGHWTIAPVEKRRKTRRCYLDGSLILITVVETESGRIQLTDFMPIGEENSNIVRELKGVRGKVEVQMGLVVRPDYGVTVPWSQRIDSHTLSIVAGPHNLILRSSVELCAEEGESVAVFTICEGDTRTFTLSHGASHLPHPPILDEAKVFLRTKAFWKGWSGRCNDAGRWSKEVRRSMVTLKGLSYLPTGGIVAAVTTSLPEKIGGERNWDYRYCWLRDATFTLLAFLNGGYDEEANSFRDWLVRAVAGSPDQIQIMYGLAGERRLDEMVLPWLPGFEGARPVRVGNDAAKQMQLDIYGELSDAMAAAIKGGLGIHPRGIELRHTLLAHLEQTWDQPDSGIWEIRGPVQHFTHSKVMAWVAFDRAANGEHKDVDDDRRTHYQALADKIRKAVCEQAIDPQRNCFTQSYGSKAMDAGLLLMAIVGFLPPEDERIRNTVSEIEARLLSKGLVLRYETETEVDGLPPGEGAFIACSFWLIDNYVLQGRLQEAEALFERLVGLANDVGLLSEEYDPTGCRLLGNFPQAFSHVALVNSAYALARAHQNGGQPQNRKIDTPQQTQRHSS